MENKVDPKLRAKERRLIAACADRIRYMSIQQITPVHEVQDEVKFGRIRESMRAVGWQGRPLLVYRDGWAGTDLPAYQALTGSHRHAVALALIDEGISVVPDDDDDDLVPVVILTREAREDFGANLSRAHGGDDDRLAILRETSDRLAARLMAFEIEAAVG
jgi:hypothetical protein